jgi:hypothetical protein
LQRDQVLIALLGLDDSGNQLEPDASILSPLADDAFLLAATINDTINDDALKRSVAHTALLLPLLILLALPSSVDLLPSATKILQPKDRYVLSSSDITIRSPDFESRSAHLYNAKRLLRARCVLILRDAISFRLMRR